MPGLPKTLHLAHTFEELKKLALNTDFKHEPEKRLTTSASKLYEKALEFKKVGDEEMLYVYCMRFCMILIHIREKRGKEFQPDIMRKYKKILEYLDDVSEKLPRRYESISKKETPAIQPVSVQPFKQTTDAHPAREKGDVPNGDPRCQFIKPKQLFDWLNCHLGASGVKKSILIIDVRPAKDYETSRIKSDRSISCPEEIIEKGKAASYYGARIQPQFKSLWEERKFVDHFVLVDWSTTSPDIQEGGPLDLFKRALDEFDPGPKYISCHHILDGGYELWNSTYPNESTCSRIQVPSKDPEDSYDINNISFPDLSESPNEWSSRSEIFGNGAKANSYYRQPPPIIDRTSKVDAELRYEKSKRDQRQLEEDIDKSKSMLNRLEQKINTKQTVELLEEKKQWEEKFSALEREHHFKEKENRRLHQELAEYRVAAARQAPKPRITQMTITDDSTTLQQAQTPAPKEKPSSQEVNKDEVTNDLSTVPLKQDTDSHMSRSFSTPNIAQMPAQDRHKPPTYDRSTKPAQQSRGYGSTLRIYGSSRSGLTGLKNLGNTCYMNSIIQCISNTSKLAEYFCYERYYNDLNESRSNPTGGEVARKLASVIKDLWSGDFRSTGCEELKRVVGRHMESFAGTSQQDSHEFLTFLIEWLHKDLCRTSYIKQVNQELLSGPNMAWAEYRKAGDSFISELFFIQQVSTVVCTKCHEKSVTYEEPTSNLTLQLPSVNGRSTLEDCLRLYTTGEQISGYRCESCGQTNDAFKKVDLWRLPQILVIHLKRFYSDGFYHKRQTLVDFPLEGLDMRNFTSNPESGNTKYNLYAVSNHYGTLEGGHYTAFCRNKEKWYKFDDQDVTETTPGFVRSSNAYILFYEQT